MINKQQMDNIYCNYIQTLIKFIMSLTRKCLDRKYFINKLQQVKFDISTQNIKYSLAHTNKKETHQQTKSKDKTVKMIPDKSSMVRQRSKIKNNQNSRYVLDRSKESKESKQSLLKSTHSYYIAQPKNKKSESSTEKHLKSYKSKDLTNHSNIINNSTFQMQSLFNTHKKKRSNFSSTIGSKFDIAILNKSAINDAQTKEISEPLSEILLRSGNLLNQYKQKCQNLQRENKKLKKKYQEAKKKIKYFQNK